MRTAGIHASLLAVLLAGGLEGSPAKAKAGDPPPLLPEKVVAALAEELSGSSAKREVQALTLHHRMRGSVGFRAAADHVRRRLKEHGLDADLIQLPADGSIFYGTQRSRPAWDAEFAELWELAPGAAPSEWIRSERVASWAARPVTLAQDSASGDVTADLVDVGEGTSAGDYQGKDVSGKLVLAAAQPGPVSKLAVDGYGAAGIVSYAQNQRTAWWKQDETLVRWGHMETFPPPRAFAFMVSLQQARAWRERLARGDRVRLHAVARAGQHPGSYDIVTAILPGRDPALRDQEVVLSCHLDHLLPGANDNASGCAAIIEVARGLASAVGDGRIERPRRNIRFIWPPEIEGTIALLNARRDLAARARAVIHMDMVGGDPAVTKAIFHVTRSPESLPSFVNDVAEAFGRFVNDQSAALASGQEAPYALADPEGGREAQLAEIADFSMGSDHQVWTEGSFRVPAIYLNDWPDRYIHTHADQVSNIDPTKLKRAAFIGAASALYLADLDVRRVADLWEVIRRNGLGRVARALERSDLLAAQDPIDAGNILRFAVDRERAIVSSIESFTAVPAAVRAAATTHLDALRRLLSGARHEPAGDAARSGGPIGAVVYRRSAEPRGPMEGFGYSYLEDRLERLGLEKPGLLSYRGRWGGGEEYAYEALNLVDGRRSVSQIRDLLAAVYGPVPLSLVAGYLDTLQKIGILGRG